MRDHLVLTVIGPDRPGIVERLSGIVAAHGGNWLASRMCRLGGEFAGIAEATVPCEQRAAVESALAALESQGLSVLVKTTDSPEAPPGGWRTARISFVGLDRPGIVHEITRVLVAHGVNVEELKTSCRSAPMTGDPLFEAEALVQIPSGADAAQLRAALETLAGHLLLDLTLEPVAG
jgi:glycine cleavage system regulatory protein